MNDEQAASATNTVPPARNAVIDQQLIRPDWTQGAVRDPRLLWLDKNENADPQLGAIVQRVVSEVDPVALSTYPECAPLYRKLADYLRVVPGKLLLAAGSDGVIRSVFEAFVNPGDLVMHTVPTFAMYSVYARMYGARVSLAGRSLPPSRTRGPKLCACRTPTVPQVRYSLPPTCGGSSRPPAAWAP